jgi:hypothetical protein
MGISKQIGWGPEANLYYQISQQLERLISVTSKVVLGPLVPIIPNVTLMIDNSPNFDIPEYQEGIVADSDYTIEWWANIDSNNNNPRAWSVGSAGAHAVSIEGGVMNYWIGGSIVLSATLPQNYIGTWSYFTVTRRRNEIGIFQNGIAIANGFYSGTIPTNGLPLYLGSRGNGNAIKGKITNFRWTSEHLYSIPSLNFTPPTAPLTVLAKTKLLIFKGNTLSAQITDQSASGYTITNVTGVYDPINPFIGVQGSIDFSYVLGFTFKVDNSAGNAGSPDGAQYDGIVQLNTEMFIDWGDGSNLQYYISNHPQIISHTFTSNDIFDVKVYMKDPTVIGYVDSTSDHGNFQILEVDYSRLNLNTVILYGNKLSSTQVNKLLNQLVANGNNRGRLLINSQIPLAPPTGQGLIDKGILITRNWTVITD